jgi:hypothetical protein
MLNDICLISKEPIEHKITLQCTHSFDYYYLYQEVIQQKNRHNHYFKCPYCRFVYNGTLPYYEIDEVDKLVQVNYNEKTLLHIVKCRYENCPKFGNKYVSGDYCKTHHKKMSEIKCSGVCKNGAKCRNNVTTGNNYCKKHIIKPAV